MGLFSALDVYAYGNSDPVHTYPDSSAVAIDKSSWSSSVVTSARWSRIAARGATIFAILRPLVSSQVAESQVSSFKLSSAKTIDQRLDDGEGDFNYVMLA